MSIPPQHAHVVCAGCLGNAVCWLCAGAGWSDLTKGTRVPCVVCAGSAVCEVCDGTGLAPRRQQGLAPPAAWPQP